MTIKPKLNKTEYKAPVKLFDDKPLKESNTRIRDIQDKLTRSENKLADDVKSYTRAEAISKLTPLAVIPAGLSGLIALGAGFFTGITTAVVAGVALMGLGVGMIATGKIFMEKACDKRAEVVANSKKYENLEKELEQEKATNRKLNHKQKTCNDLEKTAQGLKRKPHSDSIVKDKGNYVEIDGVRLEKKLDITHR